MKTLLVTTGNGMFGRSVLRALANDPDVEVRALVRNPDTFDFVADNVTPVKADMDDPASLVAAVDGVTDIFLVSPMDDHIATREINVINAAKDSGQDIRILKLHGAVEHRGDHLSQLHHRSIEALQESGLDWTLICPTSVMETCFLYLAEPMAMGYIFGTSEHGVVGFVAVDDVGQATAAVVKSGGSIGESVMLTGPEALDMYQVAAIFSDVLGRKIEYQNMTDDDFADMLIKFGAFPDRETVDMQVLCHYQAWRRGDASLVADGFEQVTGRQPTTLREWIDAHRSVFEVKA